MSHSSFPIYSVEDVKTLDNLALQQLGIESYDLMERAAFSAFQVLCSRWKNAKKIVIFCGVGKNGGDGYALAKILKTHEYSVIVYSIGMIERLPEDAKANYEDCKKLGISVVRWNSSIKLDADVLVDALFGIGFRAPLLSESIEVIDAINSSHIPVLAIDVPSGLNADTGMPQEKAVFSDATITFVGVKRGLLTGSARDYCGEIYFSDLEIPSVVYQTLKPKIDELDLKKCLKTRPLRSPSAHKGHFGHLLIVGGDYGMMGAVLLAGMAALRCGVGLVSIATRKDHAAAIASAQPELMCHGISEGEPLSFLMERATAILLGPGLGTKMWGRHCFSEVLNAEHPLVIDADGLNLLSEKSHVFLNPAVLTPHSKEAARLLGKKANLVEIDRFQALEELQKRYRGVVVLKGAGTLIKGEGEENITLCRKGNSGMASGGMGDVLSGIIGALIAQGLNLFDAANLGVILHSEAGDEAAKQGRCGLVASDLMPHIKMCINQTF